MISIFDIQNRNKKVMLGIVSDLSVELLSFSGEPVKLNMQIRTSRTDVETLVDIINKPVKITIEELREDMQL